MSDKPKLARAPSGKRPQYFTDPATDRLLSVVMTLAAELSVVRERLDALERVLGESGTIARGAVDTFEPDDAAVAERNEARAAYISRIMRAVEMEIAEINAGSNARSFDDVYKTLL